MTEAEELITRFVEDRNSLSNEEEERLVAALRESAELTIQLKEQLVMNELISQRNALDRQDFAAQVEQRVRDHEAGDDAMSEQVETLRSLAEEELDLWDARTERIRLQRVVAGLAAVLVVLAAAGTWYWLANRMQSVAVVESVVAGGNLTREQRTRLIQPGDEIMPGDRIETTAGQMVALRYDDGTLVRLAEGTIIRLPDDGREVTQKMLVLRGDVSANVTPQRPGHRMTFESVFANASVIGTQLTFSVREHATWLDVTEGKVAFSRYRVDSAPLLISASQFGVATRDRVVAASSAWPSDRQGLLFQFQNRLSPNLATHPATQAWRRSEFSKVGKASFDEFGAMQLSGGRFSAAESANGIVLACRQSQQFTIEANIQPENLRQPGLARIIALSSGEHSYNFLLCQRGDQLIAKLRTTGKDSADEVNLCRLSLGEPNHVVVTYQPGKLQCFRNGELLSETSSVKGTFENWAGQQLTLGSETDGSLPWKGVLEGVAIYDRCLGQQEIEENSSAYRVLQEDRAARDTSL